MSDQNRTSLAIWDVPMPVAAGERFPIKAGVKAASGLARGGIEVCDAAGVVVASAKLGETPWTGTEALCWAALDVPAPAEQRPADYAVRFIPAAGGPQDALASGFSVAVTARPEHTLTVTITEQNTAEALEGVEVRLGPFRGRTDAAGRAAVRVCKGEYQLLIVRTAHIAPAKPIRIDGDLSLALTMLHVPEDHPDARWVK